MLGSSSSTDYTERLILTADDINASCKTHVEGQNDVTNIKEVRGLKAPHFYNAKLLSLWIENINNTETGKIVQIENNGFVTTYKNWVELSESTIFEADHVL